ncbi:cyclin-dependent kinase inhibitor dacapo isoform X2 [Tachypleus tridentatus]|uniref:cyclin-dependent kinase inhibitor dacapo isoform X2 n=1 Tax=Tachypleus tridentatus TaxID=6853 RepID=UPI003FD0BFDE
MARRHAVRDYAKFTNVALGGLAEQEKTLRNPRKYWKDTRNQDSTSSRKFYRLCNEGNPISYKCFTVINVISIPVIGETTTLTPTAKERRVICPVDDLPQNLYV